MTSRWPADRSRAQLEQLVGGLPRPELQPRDGGDLAFDEPWQLRVLAIAVVLSEAGEFRWSDFQAQLIAVISEWETSPPETRDEWDYYALWTAALQGLLAAKRLLSTDELDERTHEVLATPANKDHQQAKRRPVAID